MTDFLNPAFDGRSGRGWLKIDLLSIEVRQSSVTLHVSSRFVETIQK